MRVTHVVLTARGGQERFRAMTHLYYRDAAGAVICYDCTDAHSEASVSYWVHELQNKVQSINLCTQKGLPNLVHPNLSPTIVCLSYLCGRLPSHRLLRN
eukprot:2824395-Amphidinium_carterae.1